jgi:hypothetical protein
MLSLTSWKVACVFSYLATHAYSYQTKQTEVPAVFIHLPENLWP